MLFAFLCLGRNQQAYEGWLPPTQFPDATMFDYFLTTGLSVVWEIGGIKFLPSFITHGFCLEFYSAWLRLPWWWRSTYCLPCLRSISAFPPNVFKPTAMGFAFCIAISFSSSFPLNTVVIYFWCWWPY